MSFGIYFSGLPRWIKIGLISVGYVPTIFFVFNLILFLWRASTEDPSGSRPGMTVLLAVVLFCSAMLSSIPSTYFLFPERFGIYFSGLPRWIKIGLISVGYVPTIFFVFNLIQLLRWASTEDPSGSSSGMTVFAAAVLCCCAMLSSIPSTYFLFRELFIKLDKQWVMINPSSDKIKVSWRYGIINSFLVALLVSILDAIQWHLIDPPVGALLHLRGFFGDIFFSSIFFGMFLSFFTLCIFLPCLNLVSRAVRLRWYIIITTGIVTCTVSTIPCSLASLGSIQSGAGYGLLLGVTQWLLTRRPANQNSRTDV